MFFMGEDLVHLSPPSCSGSCMFYGGGSVVVESLFIAAPIVCWSSVFDPCFINQYFVTF